MNDIIIKIPQIVTVDFPHYKQTTNIAHLIQRTLHKTDEIKGAFVKCTGKHCVCVRVDLTISYQ